MTAPSDVRGPAPSGTLAEDFRWIWTIFSRTVRHTEHCMIFEARVAETTYLSRGAREPLERTKRVTSHSESQLQQRLLLADFCCKSPLRYAASCDSGLLRESRRGRAMMGRLKSEQAQLFYQFELDDVVPEDHLVRKIDFALDLSWLRSELAPHYSSMVARRSIRN